MEMGMEMEMVVVEETGGQAGRRVASSAQRRGARFLCRRLENPI